MLKLKPLNQRGFDHVLILVAVIVIFALAGTYYLISSHANPWSGELQLGLNKNLCMDNSHSVKTAGNTVDIYTCNATAAQKWTINEISNNRFTLENGQDTCVDDTGGKVGKSGSTVYVKTATCSSSDHNQIWAWNSSELENVYSHGCINDSGASQASSTPLIVYSCSGTPKNELWYEATPKAVTNGGTTTTTPPPSSGGSTGTTTGSMSGGCISGGTAAPCIGSATTGASGYGKPVFDDEFTGTSLNTKTWNSTWGSSKQNQVSTPASNVSVSGGDLVLTLSSSTSGASVDTNPDGASGATGFQFGTGYYVEGRIYFPGSGSTIYNWPAFWTDGQSWPKDGEADIAEGLGTLTSNYWYGTGNGTSNNSNTIAGTWSNGWHTYALDRESGTNYVYWDGKQIRSYATHDNGAQQYLILNVGCAGGCKTGTASQVKIDYVRVWKK